MSTKEINMHDICHISENNDSEKSWIKNKKINVPLKKKLTIGQSGATTDAGVEEGRRDAEPRRAGRRWRRQIAAGMAARAVALHLRPFNKTKFV